VNSPEPALEQATEPALEQASEAAGSVRDPELGDVTIGELGLVASVVASEGGILVSLIPTFLGCPALSLIASDVQSAVEAVGFDTVKVEFVTTPIWSPERINASGRSKLAQLGIGVAGLDGSVSCPYCASANVSVKVPVGSTSCRSVWWCASCRTVVDVMRTACASAA
jgi:ring-1,2-phenylacetyl-CoA epoxidase subunit PaaD